MKKYVFGIVFGLILASCGSDDDICLSGEGTPRMKIKFLNTENNAYKIPKIFVDVDYGSGLKNVINTSNVDSVLIPLRVDRSESTLIRVRTDKDTIGSVLQFYYGTSTQYVSPACGMKLLYNNLSGKIESGNLIKSIQNQQTEINDENLTHYHFIFDAND